MPATQTIQELQAQIQNLESPTSVNAAGGPSSYTSTVSTTAASLASKVKSTVGSNAPGWVILVIGLAGYMLSETRIIGPIFTIVVIVATIFQLNQYLKGKGGHILGL